MNRFNPGCPGRRATRRQFLSGVAACTACAPAASTDKMAGASGQPNMPAPTSTSPPTSAGAAGAGAAGAGAAGAPPVAPVTRKNAADQVVLGSTGIRVSRLAMGGGTHGFGGASDQTRLGMSAFTSLLVQSFEQGVTFWETADQYGSHAHVGAAMRQVGRQRIVCLTKTHARTAAEMQADLERFLREMGTDTIDIVLLHAKESPNWPTECEGAMQYLADAKQRGVIRAHGISCHSLDALRVAARTPWVDVDLARINPAGILMDSDPATVINVLKEMKGAGKGVIGMKILGEGQLGNQVESSIRHAVNLDCIDGFTIGFTSRTQLDEVTARIAAG